MYQRMARTVSARKSTSASRFCPMKPVRAVHMVSCVMPKASFWVNMVFACARDRGRARMAAPADEVGFFFREHGAHGREGRLHDRLVSVGFEAASPQHRLH